MPLIGRIIYHDARDKVVMRARRRHVVVMVRRELPDALISRGNDLRALRASQRWPDRHFINGMASIATGAPALICRATTRRSTDAMHQARRLCYDTGLYAASMAAVVRHRAQLRSLA